MIITVGRTHLLDQVEIAHTTVTTVDIGVGGWFLLSVSSSFFHLFFRHQISVVLSPIIRAVNMGVELKTRPLSQVPSKNRHKEPVVKTDTFASSFG